MAESSASANGRVEIQLNNLSEPESDGGSASDRSKRSKSPGKRLRSENRYIPYTRPGRLGWGGCFILKTFTGNVHNTVWIILIENILY